MKVDSPDGEALTIRTHQDYLLRVLTELLNNANRFTSEGKITIGWYRKDSDAVCFFVTDTGIGIPEEAAQRIFIPFLKLDYYSEGLGIGLTLIRKGAELMGGTFEYDSTYKNGSRFILTLPLF